MNRTKILLLACAACVGCAAERTAEAQGIRFSVWDTSYTTPNAGRITCRVEFNDSHGRYVLGNGQIGHLYNIRYDGTTRHIDASWSFGGRHGVVRFDIRDNDTTMAGVWGYQPNQDVGLWDGRRIDVGPVP